jgi:hypothetical protein
VSERHELSRAGVVMGGGESVMDPGPFPCEWIPYLQAIRAGGVQDTKTGMACRGAMLALKSPGFGPLGVHHGRVAGDQRRVAAARRLDAHGGHDVRAGAGAGGGGILAIRIASD